MANRIKCAYCAQWQGSPVHKIISNNDEDEDSEKKKKKKKKEIIQQYRICKITNRKIKGTTEICRYFKPRLYFYCYSNKYWLSIYQCLSRKRNKKFYLKHENNPTKKTKKIYLYPNCTSRCSQFKDDIWPICKQLKINLSGKIKRPKTRTIKRRAKQEGRVIKRGVKKVIRTITRRNKKVTRTITRRNKKVVRVIKRRE